MIIEDYIKGFYQTEIDRGISKNYAAMERTCIHEFCDFIELHGIRHPNEVSREILTEYHQQLEQRPKKRGEGTLSSVMIRHNLNSIKYFFNYLEEIEVIEENPMTSFEMPEVESEPRIILDKAEIKLLLKNCETLTEQAIINLGYGAGLRRREIVTLDCADVDFKGSVIHVNKGKGNKKKQYKYRKIHVPKALADALKTYYLEERPKLIKANSKDSNSFLLSERGNRMSGNTVMKRLKGVIERAGIEKNIGLHSLRHSVACHLLDSGMKMELVQKFLGHSHLDVTLIYTQFITKKSY